MGSYGGDQIGRGGGGRGRGGRREEGGHARRRQFVIWSEDQNSFRIEQEGAGINDRTVKAWLAELQKELGPWSKKGPTCSSMNLSNNGLGDYAVGEIMKFLVKEAIPVLMMKLYKNWISDEGMRAIGDMIKFTPDPVVQEIHLSHNYVTQEGALAIFEAVRESSRYPCSRGREGSPLWLRMENNNIVWEPVFKMLSEWNFAWASGDTRDSWRKDSSECPVVAMHRSYHHQTPPGGTNLDAGADWYEDEWNDGSDAQSSSSFNGYGGRQREPRWARADWERSGGWDDHHYKDGNQTSESQLRRFVDNRLTEAALDQMKKFDLIFSILDELQESQSKLEGTVQELLQMQQQQVQGYPVQTFPTDGSQQHWGGDQHYYGNGA